MSQTVQLVRKKLSKVKTRSACFLSQKILGVSEYWLTGQFHLFFRSNPVANNYRMNLHPREHAWTIEEEFNEYTLPSCLQNFIVDCPHDINHLYNYHRSCPKCELYFIAFLNVLTLLETILQCPQRLNWELCSLLFPLTNLFFPLNSAGTWRVSHAW